MISRYYPSTAPLYYTVALERYFDISITLNAIDENLEIFGKTACLNKFNKIIVILCIEASFFFKGTLVSGSLLFNLTLPSFAPLTAH
jgi:hypothetical protein